MKAGVAKAIVDPSTQEYYPLSYANLFKDLSKLAKVQGLQNLATQNTKTMQGMFHKCERLSELEGISELRVNNVTDISLMFAECKAIKTLNLSAWNVSRVTTMKQLFHSCENLTLVNLNDWNTTNVTTMENMFFGCRALTGVNLLFSTGNVTSMRSMFHACRSLREINLIGWDVSKVQDMSKMFMNCYDLRRAEVEGWQPRELVRMDSMFMNCRLLVYAYLYWPGNTEATVDMKKVRYAKDVYSGCWAMPFIDLSGVEFATELTLQERNELLRDMANSVSNPGTLKYWPRNSTYDGRNIIRHDGGQFVCSEYYLIDESDIEALLPQVYRSFLPLHALFIPYAFTAQRVTNTRQGIGATPNEAYTWYMPYDAPIPANAKAYEFKSTSVQDKVVTFVRTEDTRLQAQKPYILVSTGGAVSASVDGACNIELYGYTSHTEDATIAGGEWNFVGTFKRRKSTTVAISDKLYALQSGNLWKTYNGSTLNAYPFRAYLQYTGSSSHAPSLSLLLGEDITTTINRMALVDEANSDDKHIYDLNGRYLGTQRNLLHKGVYIIGGKKVQVSQ